MNESLNWGDLEPAELDELRARLVERCDEIAISYWGEPIHRSRSELRWGSRNGSLALALWPEHKRGLWRDRADNVGGDMLAMARQENQGSWQRGIEDACQRVGYQPPSLLANLSPARRQQRIADLAADQKRRSTARDRAIAKAMRQAAAEQDTKIRKAQYLVSRAIAVSRQSLADQYLSSRGLIFPDDGWPDSVRFMAASAGQPASLVFVATDTDSRICGVQRIFIDCNACKISKVSTGAFAATGALVRLPGPRDRALLAVEGPEDGLSVWTASGCETWIAVGGIPRMDLPPDRRVIVCRDDDPEGSPADRALMRALAEWRQTAAPVFVATPWAERQYDRSDFNDVIVAGGRNAVQARIQAAGGFMPPKPRGRGHTSSSLPAFYPAPAASRDAAKAVQDNALQSHLRMAVRVQTARAEAARHRMEMIAAAGGEEVLTAPQKTAITKRVNRDVAKAYGFGSRLPSPPALLVSGGQGTGKTTLARQFIAATTSKATWWLTEPTTAKAEEEYHAYLLDFHDHKPSAMLIRGRGQPDPQRPGHQMCDRPATAERVAQAGVSVLRSLCPACPHRDVCGDQRQRKTAIKLVEAANGAVFFLANAYAFLPAPTPKPDHAILDESLLLSAIQVFSFPLADIRALNSKTWGAWGAADRTDTLIRAATTLQEVCNAIDTPWSQTPTAVARLLSMGVQPPVQPMALAYLRHHRIGLDAIKDLARILRDEFEARLPTLTGSMSDQAIEEAINNADVGTLRNAVSLVAAVLREIDKPRDTLTGVVARPDRSVLISRRRPILGLAEASLTVLDGTGDLSLSRQLFGERLDHVHVSFPRLAHVTGTRGKGYSRQSVLGRDACGQALGHREGDAGNLRGDIARIFKDRLPPGSFLCGTKRVIAAIQAFGIAPPHTLASHFSALRGLNTWQAAPGGLFIGAERISIGALEDMARAYMADDDAPFVSMDDPAPKGWGYRHWPYKATRMRRMRDGTLQPVEVEVHPDPRVQAIHEQVREAELHQAIDRLRAVWHPRQIILLNDLCLDVTYDVIDRHRDLVAGGNVSERAFDATGFVPLSPADLHRVHPDLFKTAKAAEHALRNNPINPNRNPLWRMGVVRYRRQGQHGPEARLFIDLDRHPDPRAAAIAILGPLQSVDGIPCSPNQARANPSSRTARPAQARHVHQPLQRSHRMLDSSPLPFWLSPIDLPAVPDWMPPPWMLKGRSSGNQKGAGSG